MIIGVIHAQEKGNLTGKVFDTSDGSPLFWANVLIEETAIGAAADINGQYRISNIEPGNYIFVFRYLGYETKKEGIETVSGIISSKTRADYFPGAKKIRMILLCVVILFLQLV